MPKTSFYWAVPLQYTLQIKEGEKVPELLNLTDNSTSLKTKLVAQALIWHSLRPGCQTKTRKRREGQNYLTKMRRTTIRKIFFQTIVWKKIFPIVVRMEPEKTPDANITQVVTRKRRIDIAFGPILKHDAWCDTSTSEPVRKDLESSVIGSQRRPNCPRRTVLFLPFIHFKGVRDATKC